MLRGFVSLRICNGRKFAKNKVDCRLKVQVGTAARTWEIESLLQSEEGVRDVKNMVRRLYMKANLFRSANTCTSTRLIIDV